MLMLLILSLHQERNDKNLVLRVSVFLKWILIIENINADGII